MVWQEEAEVEHFPYKARMNEDRMPFLVIISLDQDVHLPGTVRWFSPLSSKTSLTLGNNMPRTRAVATTRSKSLRRP